MKERRKFRRWNRGDTLHCQDMKNYDGSSSYATMDFIVNLPDVIQLAFVDIIFIIFIDAVITTTLHEEVKPM